MKRLAISTTNEVLIKPKFGSDQLISASEAVRSFSALRKLAKNDPIGILENNKLDSVVLSYEHYERLYSHVQNLEEQLYLALLNERVRKADAGESRTISLEEVLGKEEFEAFSSIDPNQISDEELFE